MSNRGNFNIALVAMVKNAASDGLNVSTTDRCEGVAPYNASSQVKFNWGSTEMYFLAFPDIACNQVMATEKQKKSSIW